MARRHLACKKMGEVGGGGNCLVQMEWHPAGWPVCLPSLPLHHKVQKFSSGTGSPGWTQKKGKTVVVWSILSSVRRSMYLCNAMTLLGNRKGIWPGKYFLQPGVTAEQKPVKQKCLSFCTLQCISHAHRLVQ